MQIQIHVKRKNNAETQNPLSKAIVHNDKLINQHHTAGGGHCMYVTFGFRCVDCRKCYIPYGQRDIRPTK